MVLGDKGDEKMDIIILLIKQNLIMICYMVIGYFLFKKKLITNSGSNEIGKLLLYVVLPIAIIKSYSIDFSTKMLVGLIISFLGAGASLAVSIITSRLLFNNKHRIERFSAAFSNAGFIGIPLVSMTLGEESVFFLASYVALLNILQWTYGVYAITENKEYISLKSVYKNPIVISFIIGIILFILPIKLPNTFISVMNSISAMNGPLAMIILGVYIGQIKFKELFNDKVVYACSIVRLIVIPIITIIILSIIPNKFIIIKLTILIATSAPVGLNVAIFSQMYNKDYKQAVKDICLSTILCVVTLPIIISIANYIW